MLFGFNHLIIYSLIIFSVSTLFLVIKFFWWMSPFAWWKRENCKGDIEKYEMGTWWVASTNKNKKKLKVWFIKRDGPYHMAPCRVRWVKAVGVAVLPSVTKIQSQIWRIWGGWPSLQTEPLSHPPSQTAVCLHHTKQRCRACKDEDINAVLYGSTLSKCRWSQKRCRDLDI